MPDSFHCKECDKTLRCSCQSQECGFEHDVSAHMRGHDCSCEPNDDGVRIVCPKCKWFGN